MRGVGVVIPQFMTSIGVVCADIFKYLIPNCVNQSLNVSCLLIKIFREFTVAFGQSFQTSVQQLVGRELRAGVRDHLIGQAAGRSRLASSTGDSGDISINSIFFHF